MSVAISVHGVSKSFRIHHQANRSSTARPWSERLRSRLRRDRRPDEEELFWALRDVSFTVDEGERLAIVGRNGAGKSTLLKVLSRVMAPSSGSIRIRGRLSSLLEVGTGFHPELSGRENIFLNGAILGMKNAEVRKKFDAIVDFAEVEKFLDTPVKHYSSGMYVRLAFAVSAFLEPDIMVLDEVLSVGDAGFQKKSYAKMTELAREGRTLLFVSHSMGAVREMCETAIMMDGGVASEKTRVEKVVGNYIRSTIQLEGSVFPLHSDALDVLGVEFNQPGADLPHGGNFLFDGGRPIEVSMAVEIRQRLEQFRLGFYLKAVTGEMITRALMADRAPQREFVEPGVYMLRAVIPADFLVAGDYYFELHASQFGVRDFFGSAGMQPFRVSASPDFNRQHAREQPFGFVMLDPKWDWQKVG